MMKPPAHTVTLQPTSFGRALSTALAAVLWPLKAEERMSVLIGLLVDQSRALAENEDQIEAIVDVLRMQLNRRSTRRVRVQRRCYRRRAF